MNIVTKNGAIDVTVAEMVCWLVAKGLPPLPVAPAQDVNKYHRKNKDGSPKLGKDGKLIPLYTGKNPSYLDKNGKPCPISHKIYQDRMPTQEELDLWFENPQNSVGGLGREGFRYLDIDRKNFESQEACDQYFGQLLERKPELLDGVIAQTQSGGYRIVFKCNGEPDFTNFCDKPGGKHLGELLPPGRFAVLLGIGPDGGSYTLLSPLPDELPIVDVDFIYPYSGAKSSKNKPSVQPSLLDKPVFTPSSQAGAVDLADCLCPDSQTILAGNDIKGDRSDSLTTLINELYGWENWLSHNGVAYSGKTKDLALKAGLMMGLDEDRIGRILDGKSREGCEPAAYHRGDDLACWRKVNKLSPGSVPKDVAKEITQNLKVVPIKKKAQTSVSIQDRLHELALNHLQHKSLEVEIANIAGEYNQTTQTVWRIYQATLDEIDADEDRDNTKNELFDLLSSQADSIAIDRIFPSKLSEPINKLMKWLNLRPESAATALITGLSSVCNPQTRIVLNSNLGWSESPGFNGGIVANSTQKKSPIMNTFMIRPLTKLQVEENERYEEAFSDYQAQKEEYDAIKNSKKDKDQLSEKYPDGPPQEPKKTVWYYTNTTIEKLKAQMAEQPDKGILLAVDELAGLFGNMNAYRGGKGSDRQDLLSMKDGSPISVGRKNGDVFVKSPLVSIFGTIQPKVLQKILGDGNDSDGFFARFCFVRQPLAATTLPELTDQTFDISPMIESLYRQVASLPATTYRLSSAAYSALKNVVDAYEQKRVSAGEHPIGNVYGKSGGRIGELSMLLHVIKYCFVCQIPPEVIEVETVKAAIELVAFYTNQSQAIYAELDNKPASIAPHLLKIITLAKSKGTLTPRTVTKYIRDMQSAKDKIPSYFDELEKMGLGVVHRERTIKFTLISESAIMQQVPTSADKVETLVGTSQPLQDKDFQQVPTSADKKNNFSDMDSPTGTSPVVSSSLGGDQTTNKEMSAFVGTLPATPDVTSVQTVGTLSALPSALSPNVGTSVGTPPSIEWDDLVSRNDAQIERLGLSPEDAKRLLKERYGVKSRLQLTDDRVLDWVYYCDELLSKKLVGESDEVA